MIEGLKGAAAADGRRRTPGRERKTSSSVAAAGVEVSKMIVKGVLKKTNKSKKKTDSSGSNKDRDPMSASNQELNDPIAEKENDDDDDDEKDGDRDEGSKVGDEDVEDADKGDNRNDNHDDDDEKDHDFSLGLQDSFLDSEFKDRERRIIGPSIPAVIVTKKVRITPLNSLYLEKFV